MTNHEASLVAAERLIGAARKLVILHDNTQELQFSTDKLTIYFNSISLKNGNIRSETKISKASGDPYRRSDWNLHQPPIDPPDIAELGRMANILESYLISI